MSVTHHNHQKLHDPRYIGPGIWFNMHLDAAEAKTRRRAGTNCTKISQITAAISLFKVQGAFQRVSGSTSSGADRRNARQEALFRWSVEFHNAVNAFTGKAQVSYADAHNIFYIPDFIVCSADCTDSDDESTNSNTVSHGEYKTGSSTIYSVSKPHISGVAGSKSLQITSISASGSSSGPLGYTILPAARRR